MRVVPDPGRSHAQLHPAWGTDIVAAAHATGLNPARVIGLDAQMGSIAPGKLADFVLLDPETLAVEATFIGGVERYRRTA